EIGSINPLKEIAEVCKQHQVPFHSDTVQSIGKIPVDVDALGLESLSMSAHKSDGPIGIGALYMRRGTPWIPWMHGGSQERRRRGGTLNVPGIIGLAKALELSISEMQEHTAHFKKLRAKLIDGLDEKFGSRYQINGCTEHGVPHIINLSFTGGGDELDGEMLLLNLDSEGICVSNASACTSGAVEPSHVLNGIGLNNEIANSTIRISLGKDNTEEDIDYLIDKLELVVNRMLKATTA